MKIRYYLYKVIIKIFRILNILPLLSDKIFLHMYYPIMMKKDLNLKNPKTFNEKLQWLKLYDRKPIYTTMVDKYEAKKYVADIIGEEYIIPTLGVWERFDDIDFDSLPEQFVLKCTHDSGGLVICKDKNGFDIKSAKKKIDKSLKYNYYLNGREWPYKNVKPRIIAEKYMQDEKRQDLKDYKLFCFHGNPKLTLVCSERFTEKGLKEDFYDETWKHMDIQRKSHGNASFPVECPKQYELMKTLAAKLSKGIPFSRIDFYEVDEKLYFGEITFYPASGFEGFEPEEWDWKMGEWIEFPV